MSDFVELRVGQVWRETDPRTPDRRFRILSLTHSHAIVETLGSGRATYIRRDRLRNTLGTRGYRLVEEEVK